MKNAFVLITLLLFVLSSCEVDRGGCTVWASHNFNPEADFDDGSCDLWRSKFLGDFNAVEKCANFYEYPMQIVSGVIDFDHIIIQNFGDFGINLNARASGEAIIIDNQSFGLPNGAFLEVWNGVGKFEGGDVIINYEYTYNGNPDICSITAVR